MKKFLVSKNAVAQDYQLDPKKNNLAIIFGPQDSFSSEISKVLKSQDPKIQVIGLGTSNCFMNSESAAPDQMVVSILEFESTNVKTVCLPNENYESTLANAKKLEKELTSESTEDKPLKGVLLFCEGLQINGADLPRPFAHLNIPVCGGLAAETDFKFQKTQVFFDGKELSNHIIGVGFYGKEFSMESFANAGMKPVGVMKKITKSDKNVLHMVEDRTAVEWYLDYLVGKDLSNFTAVESSEALQYPVAIFKDGKTLDGAVRTPIGFLYEEGSNNRKGSIAFTGEIPEGQYLKMMFASPDELIEKCEKSIKNTESDDPSQMVIHLSCAARQMLLGELTPYEYASSKNSVGAYVYGEIASLNKEPELLNQTFTSIRISEKKVA